jgi:hypothetical protein
VATTTTIKIDNNNNFFSTMFMTLKKQEHIRRFQTSKAVPY